MSDHRRRDPEWLIKAMSEIELPFLEVLAEEQADRDARASSVVPTPAQRRPRRFAWLRNWLKG